MVAFLIGMICPHDGGFAIKLTEKVEDLVSVLFLPLYFALSGLGTNLGLLNDGRTWGYVIAVIVIAFAGKIIGGTLAARANKLMWRESFTIGCLMSCKGLVEIIVLVSHLTTLVTQLLNQIEHWSSSKDPVDKNIHHVRCYGFGYNGRDNATRRGVVSTLVPEEA